MREILRSQLLQCLLAIILGTALLLIPDLYFTAKGIVLREQVENTILFMGKVIAWVGFLGILDYFIAAFIQGGIKSIPRAFELAKALHAAVTDLKNNQKDDDKPKDESAERKNGG